MKFLGLDGRLDLRIEFEEPVNEIELEQRVLLEIKTIESLDSYIDDIDQDATRAFRFYIEVLRVTLKQIRRTPITVRVVNVEREGTDL